VVLSDPRELAERLAAIPGGTEALAAIDAGADDVYLVGGAVRDLALGGVPADLDLVVAGDAGPLAARLAASDRPVRVHGRFGTATVEGTGGVRYDLAAARAETYPLPGALPEVTPAGIREDLVRRDFTVNALALGLSGPDTGRLLTVPHGVEDIGAGRLRVLHERSFREDPTRLLRLARYAGRLGFGVDSETARLVAEALAAGAPATVSGERIGAELTLLAGEVDPVAGFQAMRTLGIDSAIAPGFGIEDGDSARRALAVRASGDERTGTDGGAAAQPAGTEAGEMHVVLAAALLGVPEAERRPLLDRLGLDRLTRREVLAAAAGAPALARQVPHDGPPSRLLESLPVDQPATIALAAGLGSPPVAAALERWFTDYARVRLEIDGGDVIAAGVGRGPAVSAALRAALAARLDGVAPTRSEQLTAALRAARGAGQPPD
jgi:tRNA nucleotidyltransferase (CCA-adding enzyme)